MNETWMLAMSVFAGGMLGAIFFGGLWWTVQKGVTSQQPGLLFMASLLIRMTVTLVGFYLMAGSHWDRMFMCLLGFLVARMVVTRLTKLPETATRTLEGGNAP